MPIEGISLILAADDTALRHVLRTDQPLLLGVFGRPGCAPRQRVLDGLSADGHIGAEEPLYLRGGLTPVSTLRAGLAEELGRRGRQTDASAPWSDLILAAARSPSLPLVLDLAHDVAEADRRFLGELARAWRRSLGKGDVPRIVLISDDRRFLAQLSGPKSPFYDALGALTDKSVEPVTPFEVAPLPYGALARLCPEWSASDVVRGYAVFGGMPEVLGRIQPERSFHWNVTALVLDPNGPLFDRAEGNVRSRFQKPGRYSAVLAALAGGARTWQEMALSSSEFGSGSQMGAYVKRLEERGFLTVQESLDAPADSRRKRYLLSDPHDAFWFRFVAPWTDRILAGQATPAEVWERALAPHLAPYVSQMVPRLALQYLERYAAERLGSATRVSGGLWGENYDFGAAAVLLDGGVVYGHSTWVDRGIGVGATARTRREMRETRYGFGRERRTVMLFMKERPTPELERAALRDPNLEWIDADRLVTDARRFHPPATGE